MKSEVVRSSAIARLEITVRAATSEARKKANEHIKKCKEQIKELEKTRKETVTRANKMRKEGDNEGYLRASGRLRSIENQMSDLRKKIIQLGSD